MRYTNCCKSTRKNKKCTRKDGKHFSLQRRFTKKKCIKGPVKGFTMRASCAPYKFCKQKGGAKKTRKLLPKLRKISYKNKKHHYKLKDPFSKRKLAIHEGVNREAKKTGKTKKKAAIAKKGRFNILRIYRKNKKIKECNTITHDMKYMDRKYGLGKTKNICGQKGGMISEFISDDEETNNEPEPNTYFIVKNTENQIKNFAIEISKRIVEGQYMHHGYETFYYLEQLEATMLEALFSRENINGFYIVTYYPNNNGTYGGFSESFYNNLQVLHEHLQITESKNRFPNNTIELEVSVLGEDDDPNTVAGVSNFKGGGFIKKFSIFHGEFPDTIGTDANGKQVKTLAWYGVLVTPLKSGMAKMVMDQEFYNYFKWDPRKDERHYKRRRIQKIVKAIKDNLKQKNDKGVAYFGSNKFNIEQAKFVLRHLKERNNVLKKKIAPKAQQYISRLSPIRELEEKGGEDNAFSGGKRRRKTRKKRGGLDSFPIGMLDKISQATLYNNPHKDDLIRRLNHIWNILGEDEEEGTQEAFKDLIKRNPNSFYPLIIHFIQQAEAEHHGGRRKKKTRKKRGGVDRWRREPQEGDPNQYTTKDDMGYFYDCKGDNNSRYREHGIIIGDRDGNELRQPDRLKIAEIADSDFPDPQLILVDMALPEGERGLRWWRRRAQDYCNMGYKPLKRNDVMTSAGGGKRRKKKTRKKRKKKQFLYNPNDPSKSFDVYIDKNPKDTIPIKYTTVKDVKDTIKKLERLYKTKKYPHKRIWQVGMIMKVRLEAMLKHKTKKYPNAKKVRQRFNLANKYFKFLGKRTKNKDFKSRKAMTFKF